MTLSSVAPDDPIEAPLMNQLIANVNGSPGVAILTASATWVVPAGVHKFRVTLCGGGGAGGEFGSGGGGEDVFSTPGGPGGDSIARRIWVSGADIGTSYVITVGAAGAASSFGALLTVGGGGVGGSDSSTAGVAGSKGAPGTITGGTLSASALAVGNKSLAIYDTPSSIPRAFGEGGLTTSAAGAPGIVVIEW